MTDLATHAVLTPSGLTRLVDKLARDGLVERASAAAPMPGSSTPS